MNTFLPRRLVVALASASALAAACTATQDLGNTPKPEDTGDAAVQSDGAALPGPDGATSPSLDAGATADGGQPSNADASRPDSGTSQDAGSFGSDAGSAEAPGLRLASSNPDQYDSFGRSVSISSDGQWMAVGAPGEGSSAIGINGFQGDNSAGNSGAVYLFQRGGNGWTQVAYVKAQDSKAGAEFGSSVELSAHGDVLAVAAPTFARGSYKDGAVYVFRRTGAVWAQEQQLESPVLHYSGFYNDRAFGTAISMTDDGTKIAVSEPSGSCTTTTVEKGCAYVFTRGASAWTSSPGIVPQSRTYWTGRSFGDAIALSDDGLALAVGTPEQCVGSDTGCEGTVHLYALSASVWAPNSTVAGLLKNGMFGASVQLNHDGTLLVAGVPGTSYSTGYAGSVTTFVRSGAAWNRVASLFAPTGVEADEFGTALSLSANGQWLAMGSEQAVQLFQTSGGAGNFVPSEIIRRPYGGDAHFGTAVSLTESGSGLAVGAFSGSETGGTSTGAGIVRFYAR